MAIAFRHHQLDNGLNIVAEVNPNAHTSAVGFFVRAGTRDEEQAVMGVSHFLEHMMFKGTARRTADDVNREFDEIGANYNAYTSQEMTVYFAQVLPEYLWRAVDLLGDMLRPALRGDDFDTEKQVILEEIGMYEDRPNWRLHDRLLELHYDRHPLAYRVLGTTESITRLKVDEMRSYFSQGYAADNITVSAAGRIDFDRLVDELGQLAGGWEPSRPQRSYDDPSLADSDHSLADERLSRHYMGMICPAPSAQDPRRYAARVLADVLGDTEGSRLYWALIDPGLADDADFDFYPMDRVGCYYASASCAPDRAEEVERVLLKTLDSYAGSIEADELDRAKNKLATQAVLADESPGGRMRALGSQWLYLGEYVPLKEELQRIMSVTVDDIRGLMADLPFRPRTVLRLGPGSASE